MANLTRVWACWVALGCLLGLSQIAAAETQLRGARVVWLQGDRVYVASPDSLPLEPGMILTFKDRDKNVATGEVTAVHNRDLIAAKLTSGSFAKVKHLDRLQITADRPVIRAPSLLRVGYPAAGRTNLLFDCYHSSLDSSFLQGAYRAVAANDPYRLVRDSTHSIAAGWPDTLLVRLFDEVSDEEIALERGELDAAVFWPGEASTHIRKVMQWSGLPSLRLGGIHASVVLRAGNAVDSTALRANERQALARLSQEFFHGDLTLLPGEGTPPMTTAAAWFEVDASFPGRESMEQYLNRAMGAGTTSASRRIVRLLRGWKSPQGSTPAPAFEPVFEIRCPVISAPELRPYLETIGVARLAYLFRCLPAGNKP